MRSTERRTSINRGSNYSQPLLYRREGTEEVSLGKYFNREIKKRLSKEYTSIKRELAEGLVYSGKEILVYRLL